MSSRWVFVLCILFCSARLPSAAYGGLHDHTNGEAVTHTAKPEEDTTATTTNASPEVLSTADHIWPNKTVYYTFAQTLNDHYRDVFSQAIDEWSTHTCLQFQLASSPQQDHIMFVKDDQLGCTSHFGRRGGVQIVSMGYSCLSKGHAIHLIGHAIGLYQENSRPDRDEYIKIVYKNILETKMDSFEKLSHDSFQLVPDVGYDIESVMHLGPYEHTKNGKRTIRLRDTAPLDYKHCTNLLEMGQREKLSYLDKLRANRLYSCTEHITALEDAGRDCETPPTSESPPPTTTESIDTCPSSLPPLSPISPLSDYIHRLKSGSSVTLQLRDGKEGVRCSPWCRPRRCHSSDNCHSITYQFDIVALDQEYNSKINSGSKVALRSRCNPDKWLDCSVFGNSCRISKCTRCVGERCSNYDNHTSPCHYHHFKIQGVGRREDRVINSNYHVHFVREEDNQLLSCSNHCQLSGQEETEENTFSLVYLE